MKIDPTLVSMHAFGQLAIMLHDGRLMALAIVAPEPEPTNKQLERNENLAKRRARWRAQYKSKQKHIAITWGTGFYEALQRDHSF